MIFQAGNVHERKTVGFEPTTQMVQHTTLTTEDLVDGREIIKVHIA